MVAAKEIIRMCTCLIVCACTNYFWTGRWLIPFFVVYNINRLNHLYHVIGKYHPIRYLFAFKITESWKTFKSHEIKSFSSSRELNIQEHEEFLVMYTQNISLKSTRKYYTMVYVHITQATLY